MAAFISNFKRMEKKLSFQPWLIDYWVRQRFKTEYFYLFSYSLFSLIIFIYNIHHLNLKRIKKTTLTIRL